MNKTLIIDAGHGSDTAGKYSPRREDGTRFTEWEFNRAVAAELERLARAAGFAVYHTKQGEEKDTALVLRCRRAAEYFRAHGGVLVSVHANAYNFTGEEWTNANGIETYHHPEDAASGPLAAAVQEELVRATGLRSRGVKTGDYMILREVPASLPCVLAECGFYTNREELRLLESDSYRSACAEAILRGVCRFLGVPYSTDAPQQPADGAVVPKAEYEALQKKYEALHGQVQRFVEAVSG